MRWLVFLRAVNVGGTGKLPMAPLCRALEDAGARDVASWIQSGNIALTLDQPRAEEAAAWVTEEIARAFGFRPPAIALSPDALRRVIDGMPFPGADPKCLHAALFQGTAPGDPAALARYCTAGEEIAPGPSCLYLHAPNGLGRSKVPARIEAALGLPATLRGLTTLRRTLALA